MNIQELPTKKRPLWLRTTTANTEEQLSALVGLHYCKNDYASKVMLNKQFFCNCLYFGRNEMNVQTISNQISKKVMVGGGHWY
jgi:hypothetical protein